MNQYLVTYSIGGNQNPDFYHTITVTATSAGLALLEAVDQIRAQTGLSRLRVDLIRVRKAEAARA